MTKSSKSKTQAPKKSRSGKSGWDSWKQKQTLDTSHVEDTCSKSKQEVQPCLQKTFTEQGVQTDFAFVMDAPRQCFCFEYSSCYTAIEPHISKTDKPGRSVFGPEVMVVRIGSLRGPTLLMSHVLVSSIRAKTQDYSPTEVLNPMG